MRHLFHKDKSNLSIQESKWEVTNSVGGEIRCHNTENNHVLVISRQGELWSLSYSTPKAKGGKRIKLPTHNIEKLKANIEYFDKEIAGSTLKENKQKIFNILEGKNLNLGEKKRKARL